MATTRIKLQQETLDNRILTLSHSTSRFINKQDSHIDSLLRNLTDKPRKYMAAQTKQLGGGAHLPPMDFPEVGRFAILHDGQGASFAVIKLARR